MNKELKNICEQAVIRAIDLAGGQSALARLCGKKQQHVYNWLKRNKKIPSTEVIKVETALEGRLKRHEIRPDIFSIEA